jgi:DNA-binding IclR family transcriptional regulator
MSLRRTAVGDDKREAVLAYLREHDGNGKPVRQAEIHKPLGMNSGTVSTALESLRVEGLVARGKKVDRSVTWTLTEAA